MIADVPREEKLAQLLSMALETLTTKQEQNEWLCEQLGGPDKGFTPASRATVKFLADRAAELGVRPHVTPERRQ